MSGARTEETNGGAGNSPPPLSRDAGGRVEPSSLADLIQWFLNYDERVAVVRHPAVEELFQRRQREALSAQTEACAFSRAEDRLAVGVMQALVEHADERALHEWINQLLAALDEATKTNEAISEAFGLGAAGASPLAEASKLPSAREREAYLASCWLETLCTAEARVLGWAYRQLYGRPFRPDNF